MAMTTVLVPVEGTPECRGVIEAAFLAARPDGGHVVGVHAVPRARRLTAESMVFSRASLQHSNGDIEAALSTAEHEGGPEVQGARRCFHEVAERMRAKILDRPPKSDHLTASFRLVETESPASVAEQARVFDLVTVRQPRNDPDNRLRNRLRSVLFQAGRPVLVAPDKKIVSLGTRVLIAWSRSALSARAAAIARSFFRDAEEVGILSVADKGGSGPGPHDLADYIAWHGLKSTVIETDLAGRRLGDVMLEKAERFGADLLVMGAYSQSPFRESLTGGVTNYILSHAELPVLMTH